MSLSRLDTEQGWSLKSIIRRSLKAVSPRANWKITSQRIYAENDEMKKKKESGKVKTNFQTVLLSGQQIHDMIDANKFLQVTIATVEFLSFPVSIISLKGPLAIVYTNQSFQNKLNFHGDELEGKSCDVLQGVSDSVCFSKALTLQKRINIELRTATKDGGELQNTVFVQPIFDESGKHEFAFCVHLFDSHTPDCSTTARINNLIKLICDNFVPNSDSVEHEFVAVTDRELEVLTAGRGEGRE